jgi:hypothetical protein
MQVLRYAVISGASRSPLMRKPAVVATESSHLLTKKNNTVGGGKKKRCVGILCVDVCWVHSLVNQQEISEVPVTLA